MLRDNDSTTAARHIGRAVLGWALASTALCATPALAQNADEAVEDNTIIVTAQRRSEALEDVPMAVAVVTQDTLSATGINSVRDLANVTTGFQLANSGIVPQPAIRGVTTTNPGSYENNVALFVDGLYQTTAQVLNMDIPNVQSVQILKGPQGTLYGRNATGGAILVDTIDPGDEMAGNLEATYGRFNDRRARGYIGGPLTESIGLILSGTFRRTGGYYKKASRTTPGEFDGRFMGLKQESLRAKVKIDVMEGFRATLGYNYLRASDPRGVLFTPIENVANNYVAPGRNTRPRGMGEAAGDIFVNDLKQHEGSLKLEVETGIGLLRTITGYTLGKNQSSYDSSGTYVPDLYIDAIVRDRTIQQSIDLTINAIDKLDLIIGSNTYNIKTSYPKGRDNVVYLGPASLAPFTYPDPATTVVPLSDYRKLSSQDFNRTKRAWALFADATFHATDRLSINVGGRYSKETQTVSATVTNYVTSGATAGSVLSTPVTPANSSKKSSYSKFTLRGSVRYEIAPRTNIYASFSQGFRGGEWNSSVPNSNPSLWVDAKQESINAYEVGLKSASGKLRYELSGFYYDYKDLQVSAIAFVNGLSVVTLQNAPKAEIYGAEANVDYEVIENLTVRAGATWLHARYGDGFVYIGNGVNPAVQGFNSNADPIKTLANATGLAQNLSGKQMARSPDFSGFVGFDYNYPIGDGGVRLSANMKYTDSYVVTDPAIWGGESVASYNARKAIDPKALPNNAAQLAGSPYAGRSEQQRARQGSYIMVNASVTWTDPSDSYYVRVWGNNLTDKKYRIHYRPSSGTYIPMGEPLTFGGTVGVKF